MGLGLRVSVRVRVRVRVRVGVRVRVRVRVDLVGGAAREELGLYCDRAQLAVRLHAVRDQPPLHAVAVVRL